MTKEQAIYVGMINSYNLITDRATFEEIILSGLSVFAHHPDEEIDKENIELMIRYFQSLEMFEYCAELKEHISKNYDSEGNPITNECECEFPMIKKYTYKIKCSNCKKRIRP